MGKPQPRKGNRKKSAPRAKPNVRRSNKEKNKPAPKEPWFTRVRTAAGAFVDEKRAGFRWMGFSLAFVAVVCLLVLLGRELESFARSASAFAITEVTVEGNQWLDSLELQRIAGTLQGSNIFEVPPEEATERLENHPWIKSATVTRQLPHRVHLNVVEHSPVAVLALEELYLVGEDGHLFREVGVDDPVDLPFITGVERGRFVQDPAYRVVTIKESVGLLHDYRAAGLWRREPISEIHFDALGGMSLYIGDDATHIRLGAGPYRSKLRKLRTLLERLDRERARPAYVYLDNIRRPDRVTAKLR